MKDVSGWQLQLRKPGTYLHWPELAHQGQDFVVGQPRQGFEVVISAPPHAMQQAQLAMVSLSVDGRSPGHTELLSYGKREAVFRHFLTSSSQGQTMEEKFLFGTPQITEPAEPTNSKAAARAEPATSSAAGQISVSVDWARQQGHVSGPAAPKALSKAPSVQQLEGKKFYNAPSMVAGSAPATASTMQLSTKRYVKYGPVAKLKLQMESAITLVLRFPGLLKPDNPLHKPILELVAPDADEGDEPVAEQPEAAEVKPEVQQVQPQAVIKPERAAARSVPKILHLDLTKDEPVKVKRQRV